MLNSIVKKIFISIVGMFVFVMLIQLLIQNVFLEDLYRNMKIENVEKNFYEVCENIEESLVNNHNIDHEIIDYENDNGASIVVFNEKQEFLNDVFFRGFNYITIETQEGKEYRVIINFLIDEEGNFRNPQNIIKNDAYIELSGLNVKGTNFVQPLEMKKDNNLMVNDDGYIMLRETYNDDRNKVIRLSGKVIARNFVIRDEGVYSYQQDKLFEEVKRFLVELQNDSVSTNHFLREGKYVFTEEYSGLLVVVLGNKIEIQGKSPVYVLSLFNLENISDAFKVLNKYYYYIFIFQLVLILILVYFYSKWITKPLLKLIDVAQSISSLDFTKRSHVNSKDELSVLSDSLNNISNNLSITINQLEDSNIRLAKEAEMRAENEKRIRNLLTSLAHEFKTPLSIISGFLEIVGDGVYEKDPDYYISVMNEEVDKLNGLVYETIELSKLETGSYQLQMESIDMGSFIENLVKKFEKPTQEKKIRITTDLMNERVVGDKKKIEQVVVNLLSNGIRYSPENEQVSVTSQVKENNLYIFIRNYGISIEENDLDRIWDRFYRGEKSRNRDLGGSGLGLTIVKNILELHQSDYGIKNIENGVEFYFSLALDERE